MSAEVADTTHPEAIPKPRHWSVWWKCGVSLWLLYHFTGLMVSPASIPPSSQLVRDSWLVFGPYLQFIYMNQGHHFFAPDPGASTLIRYTVEKADGTTVEGRIPDRRIEPRLLYHRHFMMTESVAAFEEDRRFQPLLVQALARQLCREHDGVAISVSRVTHLLPTMEWFRAGERIDDPSLYEEQPLGRYEWADF
ncbi:MAG: hypothetical protein KDA58_15860 [Planctomycetaceae bacterium]|nr:hypothetical protein [Planctomycetaceae bacterium]